ncbi:kinB-signaling pathway activation in sporulation family protein [Anoxybacillus sp. B7M1]|uniref:KinB-signaling pathway activation protein n=1 Tax=Anoxybacteroides rupiense TaxID=311460 RepID=A0ABD5IWK1_9BACL|nr:MULTISPECIES: KinB-signaling pathway activation protein [Anoxybacillus]ANB57069.1 kinB-signaling pathway activation in sporulation family protein [Anoxybacillus sp. B2M1]ANB64233.1 kinB-signaling pathway activation in sporulation family protein [Anoxybacillus sp. B7M1]MBB3908992.1 KinB signaling pathway activation protein [Anoxybacillus rupiensis]MBS2772511.1 KinB-signaling pathway activation protein [Anoxybacillus rupiensis]MDE8565192.1 KinB-signaling pathway activation protein [Anoxybacil
MNSRKWVRLFLTTLGIGGITTALAGFIIRWSEYEKLFIEFKIGELFAVLVWFIGFGFIFSVVSQMGFFAYLTVHRFGLGIFRSVALWNSVQIVLIAFVLFDLIYFRYQLFAKDGESIISYILIALGILLVGVIVAAVKRQQTNKEAFIPSLFFMTVVTIIEWFPALRINDENWLYLMLIPLLVCNAYQLLILHKLTKDA